MNTWDDLLIYIVVKKVDKETSEEWERTLGSSTEPPSFKDLKQFILARTRTLQACEENSTDLLGFVSVPPSKQEVEPKNKPIKTRSHHLKSGNTSGSCSFCNNDHYISKCPQYLQLSLDKRFEKIKQLRLCFNCLGKHPAKECESTGRCAVENCKGKHHTSIHRYKTTLGTSVQIYSVTNTPSDSTPVNSHSIHHEQSAQISVALLATALIKIQSQSGELVEARVLLDQGSQIFLISEKLTQLLHLPRRHIKREIFGVGGGRCQVSHGAIQVKLFSRWNNFITETEAVGLPRVSDYVPEFKGSSQWKHLDGLTLSDPKFNITGCIDVILGVGIFMEILQSGLIKGDVHEPVAQQTSLGWILSGNVSSTEIHEGPYSSNHISVDAELSMIW